MDEQMEITICDDDGKDARAKEMTKALLVVFPVAFMLKVTAEETTDLLQHVMRDHNCSAMKASTSLRRLMVILAKHMEDK